MPATPNDPDPIIPEHEPNSTLDDTDESEEERGRIGYGRNERASSWMLGVALIVVVLAIGVYQWFGRGDDDADTGSAPVDLAAIGTAAPDFTLQTFAGDEVTLSEQHGKVVIVNFWGSWCEPCKREMPAFQAFWESAPEDVMMIGVGAKQDPENRSREFAESFDITYPIGRDSAGDQVATGSIARDYNVMFYPMTYVINPEGNISALVVGEMDEKDLESYVQKARDEVSNTAPQEIVANARRPEE